MPKNIIVIGSGFGGLAAAIRLQARGHKVKLFEKRDKLGGRAYVYEQNGFTFDGGPTIVTAPFLFDELWQLAGKKREDDVTFVKCDPFYRIFDHNKRVFNYNDDEMYILEQIHNISPEDKRGYLNFIHSTKAIFDKGFTELADKPFLNFTDMLKVAPDLIRMQSYLNVYPYVSKFIKDPFLRQCFSFHPLLIGGNPYDSSSIYAMIHYLERKWGVWYAMGGTGAIVQGMAKLFASLGGETFLDSEVAEILVDDGRVQGIRLKDSTEHQADDVVCNADVSWTYKNLIPENKRKKYTDAKVDSLRHSMSLFVIYFGTRKQYRDQGLAHHNIILGPRYKGLLDDIFHKKVVAQDFSLYLHMPSLTDPSMAPEGGECFYVLSPVPHLGSKTDWTTFAKTYRDRIMKFLEDNYLPGLQENLVAEHHIDPIHFRDELNSHLGAAFSVEPVLTQSAWFRPHNRSEDFSNLYFVGAGTHPGAGLPGVLSSAKIAEDLICEG
ncbi:phytoene desaturase [Deinococcus roseus]|uniref:Phytoene dehydrogenase n=1 Tax=Deinococcus roseus TaxID=392414 RepID=A0ABQ2CX33_9DEIO|nr:phytoene desaturase [Deinococcus roseus]GGJ18387.1 phytoene desaturase [Deinococcus roseus]